MNLFISIFITIPSRQ